MAQYLPRAVADGSDKEAREMMAYANTFAGYYMMCTSAHTMEHTMGSFHENLVHGAGLIMIAHSYYDFFAEKKASEEYDKQCSKVEALYSVLKDNNTALGERQKALKELREITPDYLGDLTAEGKLINDNKDAIDKYLSSLEHEIRLKAAKEELEELYRKKRLEEKEQKKNEEDVDQRQKDLSN